MFPTCLLFGEYWTCPLERNLLQLKRTKKMDSKHGCYLSLITDVPESWRYLYNSPCHWRGRHPCRHVDKALICCVHYVNLMQYSIDRLLNHNLCSICCDRFCKGGEVNKRQRKFFSETSRAKLACPGICAPPVKEW